MGSFVQQTRVTLFTARDTCLLLKLKALNHEWFLFHSTGSIS